MKVPREGVDHRAVVGAREVERDARQGASARVSQREQRDGRVAVGVGLQHRAHVARREGARFVGAPAEPQAHGALDHGHARERGPRLALGLGRGRRLELRDVVVAELSVVVREEVLQGQRVELQGLSRRARGGVEGRRRRDGDAPGGLFGLELDAVVVGLGLDLHHPVGGRNGLGLRGEGGLAAVELLLAGAEHLLARGEGGHVRAHQLVVGGEGLFLRGEGRLSRAEVALAAGHVLGALLDALLAGDGGGVAGGGEPSVEPCPQARGAHHGGGLAHVRGQPVGGLGRELLEQRRAEREVFVGARRGDHEHEAAVGGVVVDDGQGVVDAVDAVERPVEAVPRQHGVGEGVDGRDELHRRAAPSGVGT
ncbi:MAG: hypothetical protein R3A52_27420 [Polyangiales bacterium]